MVIIAGKLDTDLTVAPSGTSIHAVFELKLFSIKHC